MGAWGHGGVGVEMDGKYIHKRPLEWIRPRPREPWPSAQERGVHRPSAFVEGHPGYSPHL